MSYGKRFIYFEVHFFFFRNNNLNNLQYRNFAESYFNANVDRVSRHPHEVTVHLILWTKRSYGAIVNSLNIEVTIAFSASWGQLQLYYRISLDALLLASMYMVTQYPCLDESFKHYLVIIYEIKIVVCKMPWKEFTN